MSRIAIFILCAFAVTGSESPSQAQTKTEKLVRQRATEFLQNKPHASLSIGFVSHGKLSANYFGITEKGEKATPTANTLYEIGSITKTMMGVILAHAVHENKVTLTDDARKYLTGSYPNLEYQGHPIQLAHLLNHSSGLPWMLPDHPELFENPDYDTLPFILSSMESKYSKSVFFEDLKKVTLDTIPGIHLSYSNAAAQLLGYILENVYETPLEDLVEKYISGPLNMQTTYLSVDKRIRKDIATGYNEKGAEMPRTKSGAAGGVYSTLPDMLKYARYHLNESDPVVALSHTPTWGNILYYAMGLNWQMEDKKDKPRRIFQSGGTAGFSSFMVVYPEENVGIVLLTNSSGPDTQGELSKIAEEIFDSIAGDK